MDKCYNCDEHMTDVYYLCTLCNKYYCFPCLTDGRNHTVRTYNGETICDECYRLEFSN